MDAVPQKYFSFMQRLYCDGISTFGQNSREMKSWNGQNIHALSDNLDVKSKTYQGYNSLTCPWKCVPKFFSMPCISKFAMQSK